MKPYLIIIGPLSIGLAALAMLAMVRRKREPQYTHRVWRKVVAFILAIPLWYIPGLSIDTARGHAVASGMPFPVTVTQYIQGRTVSALSPGPLWLLSWCLDAWLLLELSWLVSYSWRRRRRAP